MKSISLSFLEVSILWLALLAPAIGVTAQGPTNQASMIKQSSIVLVGAVSKIGATSFSEVPKSLQTIVVRVSSVLKKPAAISLKKGDDVTVEATNLADLRVGTQAIFYSQGWIFGSGLAVKELGHVIIRPGEALAAETSFRRVQEQLTSQERIDRFNAKDAIIVGSVLSVRPWISPASAGAHSYVSEHEPDWQEAVIQVESAIKGTNAKQLVVRFPASRDIAWYESPKFQKGERGVFLLNYDQVTGSPKAVLAGLQVSAYTALSPEDVLPVTEAASIRSVLRK